MSGFLRQVTPLILTYDERPNLERTLRALDWAESIVAVDSGSRDGTAELLAADPRVRLFTRSFDSHAAQWSFGLAGTGIASPWVLALDADFVLSGDLVEELSRLEPAPETAGYRAPFTYCVGGRPLRSSLLRPQVVLFRRERGRYVQDGHTQKLLLDGHVEALHGRILHDDRKPLSRWLASQDAYMGQEAEKLWATRLAQLSWSDRVRRLVIAAPPLALVYCLVVKRGLLDGWAGWHYALERATAEAILSLRLLDKLLAR